MLKELQYQKCVALKIIKVSIIWQKNYLYLTPGHYVQLNFAQNGVNGQRNQERLHDTLTTDCLVAAFDNSTKYLNYAHH